jgi:hypothetical protein
LNTTQVSICRKISSRILLLLRMLFDALLFPPIENPNAKEMQFLIGRKKTQPHM